MKVNHETCGMSVFNTRIENEKPKKKNESDSKSADSKSTESKVADKNESDSTKVDSSVSSDDKGSTSVKNQKTDPKLEPFK